MGIERDIADLDRRLDMLEQQAADGDDFAALMKLVSDLTIRVGRLEGKAEGDDPTPGWLAHGRWVRCRADGAVGRVGLGASREQGIPVVFPRTGPAWLRPDELEAWGPCVGDRVAVNGVESVVERMKRESPDGVPRFRLRDNLGPKPGWFGLEELAPAPETRVIRIPAPGQRVRVTMRPSVAPAWTRMDEAIGFSCRDGSATVMLRDGGGYHPWAKPEDLEPVGEIPRWITIELPPKGGA